MILFFDGVKARPEECGLTMVYSGVCLETGTGELIEVLYDDIETVHRFPEGVHFIVRTPLKGTSAKIEIRDPAIAAKVEEQWILSRKNSLHTLAHRLHVASWRKVILAAVTVIPSVSALVLLFFFNAYRFIPVKYDAYLGERTYESITAFYEPCTDPKLDAAMDELVKSIPRDEENFNIKVTVLDVDQINALAAPGGNIFVFRKLLEEAGEATEVAGVLAHEIAHVEKRHTVQQLTRTMGFHFIMMILIGGGLEEMEALEGLAEIANTILFLKYSKGFESEADDVAIEKMLSAGIPVQGLRRFFTRIQEIEDEVFGNDETSGKENGRKDVEAGGGEQDGRERVIEWLSTHPLTPSRIEKIDRVIAEKQPRARNPYRGKFRWSRVKKLCYAPGTGPNP